MELVFLLPMFMSSFSGNLVCGRPLSDTDVFTTNPSHKGRSVVAWDEKATVSSEALLSPMINNNEEDSFQATTFAPLSQTSIAVNNAKPFVTVDNFSATGMSNKTPIATTSKPPSKANLKTQTSGSLRDPQGKVVGTTTTAAEPVTIPEDERLAFPGASTDENDKRSLIGKTETAPGELEGFEHGQIGVVTQKSTSFVTNEYSQSQGPRFLSTEIAPNQAPEDTTNSLSTQKKPKNNAEEKHSTMSTSSATQTTRTTSPRSDSENVVRQRRRHRAAQAATPTQSWLVGAFIGGMAIVMSIAVLVSVLWRRHRSCYNPQRNIRRNERCKTLKIPVPAGIASTTGSVLYI